jgi:hypothetical protein
MNAVRMPLSALKIPRKELFPRSRVKRGRLRDHSAIAAARVVRKAGMLDIQAGDRLVHDRTGVKKIIGANRKFCSAEK